MPERQPRKPRTWPFPLHLALLIIVIAVSTLSAVLLSFGALGNFFTPPSVLKQAQAIESPTSETVEPTAEVPTSDLAATLASTATFEPSATLVVTETATLEPSPTLTETETPTGEPTAAATTEPTLPPTETVVVETPTVSVEPTQTEIPPTETLTNKPANTTEPPTPTLLPVTPESQNEINLILFESGGELYTQALDSQGKLTQNVTLVFSRSGKEIVTLILPSPNHSKAMFLVEPEGLPDSDGSWALHVYYPQSRETKLLLNSGDGISASKIFGWHSNNKEIVFATDDGKIGLLDVNTGERRFVGEMQKWANLPYSPQIDGIAFSPDKKRLIVSFTLTGQGWEVWEANADGTDPAKLFASEVGVYGFSWSPNSERIAFIGNGVEVMNQDGSGRRAVNNSFVGGMPPSWSIDNRFLAFTVEAPPKYKVQLVDLEDGKSRVLVDDNSKSDVLPAWSPDGLNISFLSDWINEKGATEISVTDIQGATLATITAGENSLRAAPAWLVVKGE